MNYNFNFEEEDLIVLNKALMEAPIPYKYTVTLINKINEQIHNQIKQDVKEE